MKNFSIITYTDDSSQSYVLENSCKAAGIDLEYTGLDIPYERGVNIKIQWIQRYLQTHPEDKDDKILLFLDAYDTVITDKFNLDILIKEFQKYQCDILFSCESISTKIKKGRNTPFGTYYKDIHASLMYEGEEKIIPNCGIMIGYSKAITEYCKILQENFIKEEFHSAPTGDTHVFFKCLRENKFENIHINFEHENRLFLTLSNETFVRYSNLMKGGVHISNIKENNTFKYDKVCESDAMIVHITGLNKYECKKNVYEELYNKYCNST